MWVCYFQISQSKTKFKLVSVKYNYFKYTVNKTALF